MYLSHLQIENVKLIEELDLSFMRGGEPRMWTVLLGENGLCKTTILQAIAMAAVGYVRANQLADVGSLPDRRHPERSGKIIGDFTFSEVGHDLREYPFIDRPEAPPMLRSSLEAMPERSTLRGESRYASVHAEAIGGDPVEEARSLNLKDWFVAGYGTTRVLPRPRASDRFEDVILSRLNPLFDKGSITGTGFADLLSDADSYTKALRSALVESGALPATRDIALESKGFSKSVREPVEGHVLGLEVGSGVVHIPATWLSQGYQSTIAWIADVIGHGFWEQESPVEPSEMTGLVLIDELDLHLHPRWQVDLIPVLKKVFPRVQFIATTHSPMMLPGITGDELVMLSRDPRTGSVVASTTDESPALLTGSQIYRTFFGIDRLYPSALGESLQRYSFLVGNPFRSDEEDKELQEIRAELAAAGLDPGWEVVLRQPLPASEIGACT